MHRFCQPVERIRKLDVATGRPIEMNRSRQHDYAFPARESRYRIQQLSRLAVIVGVLDQRTVRRLCPHVDVERNHSRV